MASTDEFQYVKAKDLYVGDLVELANDTFFNDNSLVEFELGEVCEIVQESDECIAVYFEGIGGAGYEPEHEFNVKFPRPDSNVLIGC